MNSTKKNGLITFGVIVIIINLLMIAFFAFKYNDIQPTNLDTVLTPVSSSNPVSFTE